MKFICDKCKTKYSIADDKVRRKVLKIRCKNCSNIIEVRDTSTGSGLMAATTAGGTVLDSALQGAFDPPARGTGRPAGAGRGAAAAGLQAVRSSVARSDLAPVEPEESSTRLSLAPDLHPQGMPVHEDEWYLALEGHQFGPMSFDELCSRVRRGEARGIGGEEAFVWHDGLDDWVDVASVPELRPYVPPPPPHARGSGLFPVPPVERQPAGPSAPRADLQAPVLPTMAPSPAMPSVAPSALSLPPTASAPSASAFIEPAAAVPPSSLAASEVLSAAPMMAPAPTVSPTVRKDPWARVAMILALLVFVMGAVQLYIAIRPRNTTTHVVAPLAGSATPTGEEPISESVDAGGGGLEFQAVEVARGKVRSRGSRAGGGASGELAEPSSPSASSRGTKLTAEKQRLLDLYGSQTGTGLPETRRRERRQQTPSREISSQEVARMMQSSKGQIQTCFERATKRDYSLRELRVDAGLTITSGGRVKSVSVKGTSDDGLVRCLRIVIKKWVFKPVGGDGADLSFPILLRGS